MRGAYATKGELSSVGVGIRDGGLGIGWEWVVGIGVDTLQHIGHGIKGQAVCYATIVLQGM